MQIISANTAKFDLIKINVDDSKESQIHKFEIRNGDKLLSIEQYSIYPNNIELTLKEPINIKKECYVTYENQSKKAQYGELFISQEFDNKFHHDCGLGAVYDSSHTVFKLWSPAASSVNLLLYETGDPSINENPKKFRMHEANGLWTVTVKGNLKGYYYTYQLKIYNELNEAVDPYAKAVGINGLRGAVIDLSSTNPKGWEKDYSPRLKSFTDAIIYEANIRDISIHADSGVINKGKFLGLTEDNTTSGKGISTALNHIKELGITHLQLMPVYDFSCRSVDEKDPIKYNWGYDPQNYNVPEGSYSTDPYSPPCRIVELKRMIQHLHRNGIGVIMDVVYNHTAGEKDNNFEKIFPGYYFRQADDGSFIKGSGCENDTASERSMARKFIVDSVLYWTSEFHIDGFRFDLMGLHDITTMNIIRQKLDNFNRPIMIYGEGWNLGTALPEHLKANMFNAKKMPRIGYFNDIIRDTLKGSVFSSYDRGFVSGKEGVESQIKRCITACITLDQSKPDLFLTAEQSINYVSAHDNNTLWDKFEKSNGDYSFDEKKALVKLSNSIILTSQGIPFIHSGEEFCRTKYGQDNSYKSPDNINRLDWDRKAEFLDVFDYYKGIINIRKEHPAFRKNTPEEINKHVMFLDNTPKNTIAFILKDYANEDTWRNILVIYNANRFPVNIEIPFGNWNLVVNKNNAGLNTIAAIQSDKIAVEGISTNILYSL